MPTKQLVSFADSNGIAVADTAATPGTAALRDSSGGCAFVQLTASEHKTTGIETTAVKAVQTASTTLDGSAVVWPFDTTAGSLVPTLPPASTVIGRQYRIIKTVAGNSLTITPTGADTINGASTLVLTAAYATARLVANAAGNGWWST